MKIKICIAGINGYTGQILRKLVNKHPNFELVGSLGTSKQKKDQYSYFLDDIDGKNFNVDFLLLATPADISIKILEKIQQQSIKVKVLDLSGAFRLDKDNLSKWYGLTHSISSLEKGAKYGLSPYVEFSDSDYVIANPGCYATCVLLSLIPLFKNDLIKSKNLIIDAKSGVSGAGKVPRMELMFTEMVNNFFPYKIAKHQHTPEILKALVNFNVKEEDLYFNTSMLPIHSGICVTIYADLNFKDNVSNTQMKTLVYDAYANDYNNYPLFKLVDIANQQHNQRLLSIKSVVGTANIHLGFLVKSSKVIIFSFIDNLLKGAATQAIENLNNYYNFPINKGL